ncbi:MAG: class I SAM-dependent methyltransferase [Chthoniobacteraceae bacterium]|nr:class I SAM-dependent methyltransferase [Chthoniobacteraceae bacterium]
MNLDPIQEAARAQFARQSANYGKGHTLENIEDVIAAAAQMTLPPGARVLDVAAANGHTGLYFASLGHRVILADIAAPMLERARELAAERGLAVETREHPAEALPYPGASFDLVTCRVAAHHFSSPEAFVRESARVLKPGGWFLLIDNSVEDGDPVAEDWIHQVDKLHDASHVRALAPAAWRALCAAAGLEVQSTALTPFKQPNLQWYFDTSATPEEARRKTRELIAHAPEEARRAFHLTEEPDGNVTWEWPRLTLIARKAASV